LLKRAMHYKNQAVSIRDNVEAPPVNKEIEWLH
jgi:hypothetical protein